METKMTQATVRIALSSNFCTFEVSAAIQNENGLTTDEINNARKEVYDLANKAKVEFENKSDTTFKKKEQPNVDISDIEKLPLYTEVNPKSNRHLNDRIAIMIKSADSIAKLNQLLSKIGDDEVLQTAFNKKLSSLKKAIKPKK